MQHYQKVEIKEIQLRNMSFDQGHMQGVEGWEFEFNVIWQ